MNKYKLINITTKEETICDRVIIDGFDYYTVDKNILEEDYLKNSTLTITQKRVVATNSSNFDLPKIIDEVDNIIRNAFYDEKGDFKRSTIGADDWINGLKLGYNKAKETYQFTEQDMIDFNKWVIKKSFTEGTSDNTIEELLDIWKSQQPTTMYYE